MKNLIKNIEFLRKKINASHIGTYSAQTAFFMFLSLVPLVLLSFSLIKYIGPTQNEIAAVADEFTPSVLSSFFSMYVDDIINDSKITMTIVSFIVLLWSASKGIFSIIGGLNSVYRIKENRGYFSLRFTAVFYTVAFIVMLICALLLMVFGNYISNILYSILPNLKGLVYIISSLRFIIAFLFLVLFFSLLYKALPSGKHSFTDQIPGAIISSAGWVSFSLLFSFFVNNFSNYANVYGSLTAIIVLMLWLYICMYIMFFGAEINVLLKDNM